MSEPLDISAEVAALCAKVEAVPGYVGKIEILPHEMTVTLYHGKSGRCAGPKAVDYNGPHPEPVTTIETYRVKT